MSNTIDLEKAKELLSGFTGQAEQLLANPSTIEGLLQKVERRLKEIPKVGNAASRFPLMLSMIRAYVSKEYTEVSVKAIVTMLCASLYLVMGVDLIPDKTPLVGYADDLAVIAAALYFVEPELNAYSQWRERQQQGV